MDYQEVLDFWFGPMADDEFVEEGYPSRWYKKDPEFDQEIKDRFGDWVELAAAKKLDQWKTEPCSLVALIILLDQFTRNIYRDSPKSWACDPYAQQLVKSAIENKEDQHLRTYERHFLYMPLMHSEDKKLQDLACAKFEELVEDAQPRAVEFHKGVLSYAYAHRDIVKQFGRFPHRNKVLGRVSTAAETEFLKKPNSSF